MMQQMKNGLPDEELHGSYRHNTEFKQSRDKRASLAMNRKLKETRGAYLEENRKKIAQAQAELRGERFR